ncbi:MAG: hypothetical protein ACXAE3_07040, partial [Candidatus Kariarchaeaceae archaeon]
MIGTEFREIVSEILHPDSNVKWGLRRPKEKNEEFRVKIGLLSGMLTNQILGLALAKEVNLIIVGDRDNHLNYVDRELEMIEILYKNDIRILEWSLDSLIRSTLGGKILANIFQADHTWYNEVEKSHIFTYRDTRKIKSILSRVEPYTTWKTDPDAVVEIDQLVYSIEPANPISNYDLVNSVIVQTTLCSNTYRILANGNTIIHTPDLQLRNEIARELYYLIKPRIEIPMYLEFNKSYFSTTEK